MPFLPDFLARIPERLRNKESPSLTPALPLSEKSRMVLPGNSTLLLEAGGKGPLLPPGAPFAAALRRSDAESEPLLDRDVAPRPRRLPQAIAHRGYKAVYPENTMAAFRNAVEIGAHAIETDLHLSRDGIVVLSHDATLKRCFGEDTKVSDCDWSHLSSLRTLRKPHEPMPRLLDLLEYMAEPEHQDVWVLLDVKRDDDCSELLSRVAATIASMPASRPWSERITMGCWNASYVRQCLKYLPGFPLTYIGWSLTYARELLHVPNMNFNLLQHSLVGPIGTRFLRDARGAGRVVFVWTVNDPDWMEWSIRKGLDGVITDDPKKFLEICDRSGKEGDIPRSPFRLKIAKHAVAMVAFQFLAALVAVLFLFMYGPPRKQVRQALRG